MGVFKDCQRRLSNARPKLHRDETESGIKDRKRHQTALIWREIEALRGQSVAQLRGKYLEVFGHESRSNHKQFLVRRIAWRLQANAEGDLVRASAGARIGSGRGGRSQDSGTGNPPLPRRKRVGGGTEGWVSLPGAGIHR